MPRFAFEDFSVSQILEQETIIVDKDEMIAFARRFDPQPFHLSEKEAEGTFIGRLVAPGWFSCSLLTQVLAKRYLADSTLCGGMGMRELRWLKPVFPGDSLRVLGQILEKRESSSRPGFGIITIKGELINQSDEVVLSNITTILMGLRGVTIPPLKVERKPNPGWVAPVPDDAIPLPFVEDVCVGHKYILGSHTFTSEDIKSYARVYDPQPFHVDEAQAKKSFFGDLCASGIQTAAIWSTFSALYNEKAIAYASSGGKVAPRFGVSPGIKDLHWYLPVYAGDTVTYRSEVLGHRRISTHSGWGILVIKATGENQYGQKVLEYRPSVLLEANPAAGH